VRHAQRIRRLLARILGALQVGFGGMMSNFSVLPITDLCNILIEEFLGSASLRAR